MGIFNFGEGVECKRGILNREGPYTDAKRSLGAGLSGGTSRDMAWQAAEDSAALFFSAKSGRATRDLSL